MQVFCQYLCYFKIFIHCYKDLQRELFQYEEFDLMFNPFLVNVPILYPLKTPENLWFSGVFRGYKMGTLERNGLTHLSVNAYQNNHKFNQ